MQLRPDPPVRPGLRHSRTRLRTDHCQADRVACDLGPIGSPDPSAHLLGADGQSDFVGPQRGTDCVADHRGADHRPEPLTDDAGSDGTPDHPTEQPRPDRGAGHLASNHAAPIDGSGDFAPDGVAHAVTDRLGTLNLTGQHSALGGANHFSPNTPPYVATNNVARRIDSAVDPTTNNLSSNPIAVPEPDPCSHSIADLDPDSWTHTVAHAA